MKSHHKPHARSLRSGRQSEREACYAITKCVAGRRLMLATPDGFQAFVDSWTWLRSHEFIRLLGFCIMRDHYHMLFFLTGSKSLSQVMNSIGKFTARRFNEAMGLTGEVWQDGFFDHRCRDEDDTIERLTYTENNPVRAGLVIKAEEWPYSSAFPANAVLLDRDWYRAVR